MSAFEELEDKVDELQAELDMARECIKELQYTLARVEDAITDTDKKARNY
jgi:prefoldin subunit 5